MNKLILQNIEQLISRKNEKKFYIENYQFKFMGEGSFGIIYKVSGNGKEIIIKIMKNQDREPRKCLKIKKKIEELKDKNKKELIKKYTTNILEVELDIPNEVIFMEYLDGEDLSDYLDIEKEIEEELFYVLVSKILLAVFSFHYILKYSHRDLKLGNIFYNPNTKILKLIDFGFACPFNDYDCYNRYQGTSIYIHPLMNKKVLNNMYGGKYLKGAKSKIGSPSKIDSPSKIGSPYKKKRYSLKSSSSSINTIGFPKPRSQDIFSVIIIIFKIYSYIDDYNSKTNLEEQKLDKYLNLLFSHNSKTFNRKNKFTKRFEKKNIFFKNLNTINPKEISNKLISGLIEIIKKYWNFDDNNFISSKGNDKSKKIFYELLELSINNISNKKVRNELNKDKKIVLF